MFVAFSGICVIVLALRSDFGTAAYFLSLPDHCFSSFRGFCYNIFEPKRGQGFAGFLAVSIKPYIAQQICNLGKAWQFANEGGLSANQNHGCAASGRSVWVGQAMDG
jgi:hypothetical protein